MLWKGHAQFYLLNEVSLSCFVKRPSLGFGNKKKTYQSECFSSGLFPEFPKGPPCFCSSLLWAWGRFPIILWLKGSRESLSHGAGVLLRHLALLHKGPCCLYSSAAEGLGSNWKNAVICLPIHCCYHVNANAELCFVQAPLLPDDIKLFGC